ncbi:hypothetical protein D9758_011736 [Tetrapyrgos nigripes]|uniref:TPR-like protein n=1 Tax=Tetrapyrgos nigripes TaxID=182062 RepID=A0A8H5GD47_9AGAR|nr:hypothetical protein D9758_011736 [Tetrapyrgos nigripes]
MLHETDQVHIAILGAGGIGKTSVALHIMENLVIKEKFAGRCYFIPCEKLPDATILVQGLVQAIGLQLTQGKGPLGVLLDYLKGQCQEVLIILDNFETPWNSKSQTEVKNTIEHICSVKLVSVIMTMRGTDGPGEIKWHKLGGQSGLPAHELGPAKEAFFSFTSYGSYTIKQEEDPVLVKLLMEMDGMPLAIMLIAQHARELPLNDLMEMWNSKKTAVLKKFGPEEQDNRLTSIEVSIELTLNIIRGKLSPTGENVLRLVALLPSGIPNWLENLPNMLRDATMQDHIWKMQVVILKKSCLIYEARDKTLKMLTPIGEYIMKIFQRTEHLENQVWSFYESFIDNLPQNSIVGDILLELHVGNIFKILQIQIEKSLQRSHMKVLRKLCNSSQYYSGLLPLVKKCLRWKLQINLSDQTELMFMQENMLRFLGEYRKAIQLINSVEELYKHQIDQEASNLGVITSTGSICMNNTIEQTQAECYQRLGRNFYYQGNYTQSQQKVQQARDLYENLGDKLGAAYCLQNLGNIYRVLSQYEDAKVMLQQAKEGFEGLGYRLGAAQCLYRLGDICQMLNQHEDAKVMLQQAKEQFEGVGDRLGVAQGLHSLGDTCQMLQQYEHLKPNSRLGAAQCLRALGNICRMLNQYEDAKVMLQLAKEEFEGLGYRLGAAQCLHRLGDICQMLNQHEDAKTMHQQAKEQFERIGDRLGAAQCLQSLGDICQMLHQYEEAKIMLQQAKKQFKGLGSRLRAVQCLRSLGNICRLLDQHEDAKVILQQAKEQFEGLGDRLGAAQCLRTLGIIDHEQGHLIVAKANFDKAKEYFEAIPMPQEIAFCVDRLQQINEALVVAVENQAESMEV